jgi:hypothetical protein
MILKNVSYIKPKKLEGNIPNDYFDLGLSGHTNGFLNINVAYNISGFCTIRPVLIFNDLYEIIKWNNISNMNFINYDFYYIKNITYNKQRPIPINETYKFFINTTFDLNHFKQFFYCYTSLGDPV